MNTTVILCADEAYAFYSEKLINNLRNSIPKSTLFQRSSADSALEILKKRKDDETVIIITESRLPGHADVVHGTQGVQRILSAIREIPRTFIVLFDNHFFDLNVSLLDGFVDKKSEKAETNLVEKIKYVLQIPMLETH